MSLNSKPKVSSYRDLRVWQKAVDLAVSVYRLTAHFPREETYGMTAQMRRCSVSIPSNIAEGHGRLTKRDYRHFLSIARGSNFELQTQLEIANLLGYGDPQTIRQLHGLSEEVGKMIYSIVVKLEPIVAAPDARDPSLPSETCNLQPATCH